MGWPIYDCKCTLSNLYSNLEILWDCKNWINAFLFFIFYDSFELFPHWLFFFICYKIWSFQFLSKNILKCFHDIWIITFFFLCFFLWCLFFLFWNRFFVFILFNYFLNIIVIICLNTSQFWRSSTLWSFINFYIFSFFFHFQYS